MEYISEKFIENSFGEILSGKAELLITHALIKAQAKDYIRDSQIRLILEPIFQRLFDCLGNQNNIQIKIIELLNQSRYKSFRENGYLAGNLINLLGTYANRS